MQRVSRAEVRVDDVVVGAIGTGLVLLVGVEHGDTSADVAVVVDKVVGLRVFEDTSGKMNLSVEETGGQILVVSQFTLLGDLRRGRRPSFTAAAPAQEAAALIDEMIAGFASAGVGIASGVFGAKMEVDLVNHGPVTLVFDVRNATLS
jgi:D-tyrosyl-tRNA(Tyr) deacylase